MCCCRRRTCEVENVRTRATFGRALKHSLGVGGAVKNGPRLCTLVALHRTEWHVRAIIEAFSATSRTAYCILRPPTSCLGSTAPADKETSPHSQQATLTHAIVSGQWSHCLLLAIAIWSGMFSLPQALMYDKHHRRSKIPCLTSYPAYLYPGRSFPRKRCGVKQPFPHIFRIPIAI